MVESEGIMWDSISYDQCLSFVNCQLKPATIRRVESKVRPTITISRMTGAGGRSVAAKLGEYLQTSVPVECRWTVFDRDLMDRVLEDHHLSRRVVEHEPEDHKPFIRDAIEELLGLHPSTWTIVQHTAETILRLAGMGNVILVGRGANVVTAKLKHTFHLRLVGSLGQRVHRVEEVYRLDAKAAAEFVRKEDQGRRKYLKAYYDKDIDDPLIYDLVINTDAISYEAAARLVGEAVISRFHLNRPTATIPVHRESS